MIFETNKRARDLHAHLSRFMDEHVFPNEAVAARQIAEGDRWQPVPIIEALKVKAKAQGLWNLFLPESEYGAGLGNLEYAPLCELMGRSAIGAEPFNCSAPDTGNMETLVRYASEEVRQEWLVPLLEGEIRSSFCMTEPDVASSDATSIRSRIERDGDDYVLNGRKWWSSGAGDPRCKVFIFMGKTDPEAPRHRQQSMIVVPRETPGVTIERTLSVYGYDHAPHGHAQINFENVRVPAKNLLLGEGRGFEIAQGRLGPGRIHHCMRSIGAAERALSLMCERVLAREAFGATALGDGVDPSGHRAVTHRDRPGPAHGAQRRAHNGHGREQGGAEGNLDDQGHRPVDGAAGDRPRRAGARGDGRLGGLRPRGDVGARAHAAPGGWTGRGAPRSRRSAGDQTVFERVNAPPKYYAHSGTSEDRENWHRLSEHLDGAGARAAGFLDAVGGAEFAMVAGLLHDLGKYTQEFQDRLSGGRKRVNHSTAGAKMAVERYGKQLGKMLAFCIAGHHSGLANGVNGEQTTALEARLKERVPTPDPIWEQEIALPANLPSPRLIPRDPETAGFCAAFFIRMLFSALVDADYLDTEDYFAGLEGGTKPRGQHPALGELRERLNAYLDQLATGAEASPVNDLRQEVLAHVRGKAAESPGLFTLTVPTGGGKTLASLAFALDHARRHGLARVIYVIPYMSIIEQTAAVFRKALRGGDTDEPDFVIEHHSTFDEDRIGKREARDKLRLAMENWDAPIIVTTAVQFFESLFSNRPSRCRKLHNVANSVVILDEAQTLPLQYLRPCVTVLDELARNWRTSVVLCTATQPALAQSNGFAGGFENVRELAPEPKRLYRTLKRTRVRREGQLDDASVAQRLHQSPQALCIVNTRRHARELYECMADAEGAAHLTTLMCARHRREKLDAVRERLRNGAPVRLIATSLVEAGVGFGFPGGLARGGGVGVDHSGRRDAATAKAARRWEMSSCSSPRTKKGTGRRR